MNKNEANMILELLIEQAADKSVLEINMWSDHTHSDANKYSIEFRHESAAVAYIMLDAYLAYVGPRTGSNPTKLPHFQYADPNFAENVLKHAKNELISSLCTSLLGVLSSILLIQNALRN